MARFPLICGDEIVSTSVGSDAQKVIDQWAADQVADLDTRLKPFGLSALDIVNPEYRRVLFEGDCA